jgi:hypothetical protein
MKQQVEDFKDYKSKLIEITGPDKAADLIFNALYTISAGSNDFVNNYFLVEREVYTISQWREQIRISMYENIKVRFFLGCAKQSIIK